MEKKEILAEFMGFNKPTNGRADCMKVPKGEDLKYKAIHLTFKQLEYNASYDWFMPVWEKFRDLNIEGGAHRFSHNLYCKAIMGKITHDTLPEAFEELVKGVIWYNSIK